MAVARGDEGSSNVTNTPTTSAAGIRRRIIQRQQVSRRTDTKWTSLPATPKARKNSSRSAPSTAFMTEHGEGGKRQGLTPLLSIFDDDRAAKVDESALLSEPALGRDWNRPEEDAAWSYLQPAR